MQRPFRRFFPLRQLRPAGRRSALFMTYDVYLPYAYILCNNPVSIVPGPFVPCCRPLKFSVRMVPPPKQVPARCPHHNTPGKRMTLNETVVLPRRRQSLVTYHLSEGESLTATASILY